MSVSVVACRASYPSRIPQKLVASGPPQRRFPSRGLRPRRRRLDNARSVVQFSLVTYQEVTSGLENRCREPLRLYGEHCYDM
jgi:hypothetical protein